MNKMNSRYSLLLGTLILSFILAAAGLIGGTVFFVNHISGLVNEYNMQQQQETEAQTSLGEANAATQFPVLEIGEGNFGSEKTTDNLKKIISGLTTVTNYGAFREIVSLNVPTFVAAIGSEVTITSPTELGADTEIIVSDTTTSCMLNLVDLSSSCS